MLRGGAFGKRGGELALGEPTIRERPLNDATALTSAAKVPQRLQSRRLHLPTQLSTLILVQAVIHMVSVGECAQPLER